MKAFRYKLEVNLSIVKEEWSGATNPDGTANEESGGYWNTPMGNERLTVNETMGLGSMDFMALMSVLGQLHGALKTIQEENCQ